MPVVCEIENRSKRSFIIGLGDHIKGGKMLLGTDQRPTGVSIPPDTTAHVTEACGKRLSSQWKNEIRIVRKISRKE